MLFSVLFYLCRSNVLVPKEDVNYFGDRITDNLELPNMVLVIELGLLRDHYILLTPQLSLYHSD